MENAPAWFCIIKNFWLIFLAKTIRSSIGAPDDARHDVTCTRITSKPVKFDAYVDDG